ncbi:hypothetical protein A3B51_01005 [Candidatus Curtissbacteria bacterium RIFCSPLOWO2_01_FULL_41_18]|uniref:DUF2292 domain-containing protein n=1 Tax=Candidatus Curtissbacteria bacterium RIFCSPLOWO2_01_FULL_41_18 TaxID=1797727 RepID=A0A1F5HN85_9BACT|nr:MAG: hypothetical protein A3B51_01005 [Candidatus Curtissbacteria bacterium RIFCSPLOWO2_01_FULL_41_18]
MDQTDQDFSTQNITPQLIGQIVDALKNKAFGSVEIYIQNYKVTQITERTITKVASLVESRRASPQNSRKTLTVKHNGQDQELAQEVTGDR